MSDESDWNIVAATSFAVGSRGSADNPAGPTSSFAMAVPVGDTLLLLFDVSVWVFDWQPTNKNDITNSVERVVRKRDEFMAVFLSIKSAMKFGVSSNSTEVLRLRMNKLLMHAALSSVLASYLTKRWEIFVDRPLAAFPQKGGVTHQGTQRSQL